DHAGRCLLHAADHVLEGRSTVGRRDHLGPVGNAGVDVGEAVQRNEDHRGHQVGPVVHRDVRLVLQGRGDVFVINVGRLTVNREDGNTEIVNQAGGHVVLGRQRVGGDEHQVGPAGLNGASEVGGLGGDVQAGGHA